jgi:uncharacterized Ntn-hydrolase superfamily protein
VEWSGASQGDHAAVQGNMLRPEVMAAAHEAFEASAGCSLAHRLMIALEAGAEAGGDRRCSPALGALSAVLAVAHHDDPPGRPYLRLSADVDPGFGMLLTFYRLYWPYTPEEIEGPIDLLRAEFDAWHADKIEAPHCSSR